MTRRLIASHIRRRLSWLSAAYAQSSALAEARDRATFAEWLRRAREATAEFADSLPKTASGKIRRGELRDD